MTAKKSNWNSICNVNGVKMSVTQRNKIIKNKYIYEDVSLQDLAKEFNISYQTVRCLSSKEKWKEREREEQQAKEQQENSGLLHDLGTYVDANVANYKSIDAAGEWNDAAQRLANKDYNSDEEFRDLMAKVQNSEAEQQIYNQEY